MYRSTDKTTNYHKDTRKSSNKSKKPGLKNYKGEHFGEDVKQYSDPETGAHFNFGRMCERLRKAQRVRKEMLMIMDIEDKNRKRREAAKS